MCPTNPSAFVITHHKFVVYIYIYGHHSCLYLVYYLHVKIYIRMTALSIAGSHIFPRCIKGKQNKTKDKKLLITYLHWTLTTLLIA